MLTWRKVRSLFLSVSLSPFQPLFWHRFVCSGALSKHKMGKLADTERQTNFIMGHCKVHCSTHKHTLTHLHSHMWGCLSERIELKCLLVCNRFLSSRCSLQLKLFVCKLSKHANWYMCNYLMAQLHISLTLSLLLSLYLFLVLFLFLFSFFDCILCVPVQFCHFVCCILCRIMCY